MNKLWPWVSWAALAIVFIILAIHQYHFVKRYSVNLMYWDQWGLYQPMFHGESWWATFDYQWGPHRQGVGGLVARALADLTRWDSRADSFGVSFALTIAAAFGIGLGYFCGVREPLALVAIPILYFNRRQYEQLVFASNISHGAMPMLLFTLFCLSWFIRQRNLRLLLLTLLTFCLIFTGFGLFVGLVFPAVLIVEFIQNFRCKKPIAGIIVSLIGVGLSWLLFDQNYHFWPMIANFKFPWDRPLEYFYFVGVMLSNFFGYTGHTPGVVTFGLFIALLLGLMAVIHGWRLIRYGVENQIPSVIIFTLATFELIYCANTAIGRVPIGWQTAAGLGGSRYVTLMIPAGVAIFLQLATLEPRRLGNVLAVLFALSIVYGTNKLNHDDWAAIRSTHDGRQRWRKAYWQTHNQIASDNIAGFKDCGQPVVGKELAYLEAHHLNLFKDHP